MFLQGRIFVSARRKCLLSEFSVLMQLYIDSCWKKYLPLYLTKKLFIRVSTVCRSRLVIFYFKEKFCLARVGKSLARCLFPKRSEDLVEKIFGNILLVFDTNWLIRKKERLLVVYFVVNDLWANMLFNPSFKGWTQSLGGNS